MVTNAQLNNLNCTIQHPFCSSCYSAVVAVLLLMRHRKRYMKKRGKKQIPICHILPHPYVGILFVGLCHSISLRTRTTRSPSSNTQHHRKTYARHYHHTAPSPSPTFYFLPNLPPSFPLFPCVLRTVYQLHGSRPIHRDFRERTA